MRAVSDLATRLLAVDWTVDYDEPVELMHFAALRDADAVPRDLSDPFEPFVRVFELGGPISRDCSGLFMEFGCTAAVPIRDQKFWAEAAR